MPKGLIMNIARGNRKIKAYQTGQGTIRRVEYTAMVGGELRTIEGFIVVVYFSDWKKAHAIDPAKPKPFGKGKLFPSKGKAWEVFSKYCPNIKPLPSVTMPLARGDYYYGKIAPEEKAVNRR